MKKETPPKSSREIEEQKYATRINPDKPGEENFGFEIKLSPNADPETELEEGRKESLKKVKKFIKQQVAKVESKIDPNTGLKIIIVKNKISNEVIFMTSDEQEISELLS